MNLKKAVCLLLALCLVLSGCSRLPAPDGECLSQLTALSRPVWTPFTGKPKNYTYRYSDGRSRAWEEDLIFFGASYLEEYAPLTHFPSRIETGAEVEYSTEFYDPALREQFLENLNNLILMLPELNDTEIFYRMQKMVADFHDAHVCLLCPWEEYFPIEMKLFYRDVHPHFVVTALPSELEDLLLTELIAINGRSLNTLLLQAEPYLSYENRYCLLDYFSMLIPARGILTLLGALEPGDDAAAFSFRRADGSTETRVIPLSDDIPMTGWVEEYAYTLAFGTNSDENYWFRTYEDERTIYVRINQFEETPEYTFMELGNQILHQADVFGTVQKIIVDLRQNPGGVQFYGYDEFIRALARIAPRQLYVLIDDGTFSNGVVAAARIRETVPGALLVGTPAGQPPNFFAGLYEGDYIMPNSGIECPMPTAFYVTIPDYPDPALLPDIPVYPTLEDFDRGIDTILQYVFEQ